jgi:hypothetical protein
MYLQRPFWCLIDKAKANREAVHSSTFLHAVGQIQLLDIDSGTASSWRWINSTVKAVEEYVEK